MPLSYKNKKPRTEYICLLIQPSITVDKSGRRYGTNWVETSMCIQIVYGHMVKNADKHECKQFEWNINWSLFAIDLNEQVCNNVRILSQATSSRQRTTSSKLRAQVK